MRIGERLTALAIRRSISDRAGVAQSTTNLGVFHRNLGENRAAIRYFEEALAMRRKLNVAQGTAATLANLGVAHADLGNFEESLAFRARPPIYFIRAKAAVARRSRLSISATTTFVSGTRRKLWTTIRAH